MTQDRSGPAQGLPAPLLARLRDSQREAQAELRSVAPSAPLVKG